MRIIIEYCTIFVPTIQKKKLKGPKKKRKLKKKKAEKKTQARTVAIDSKLEGLVSPVLAARIHAEGGRVVEASSYPRLISEVPIFSSLFFYFLFFFSLYLCLSLSEACRLQALHMFFCFCFFCPKLEELESFHRSIDRNVVAEKNQLKDKRSPLPFNADMENLAK